MKKSVIYIVISAFLFLFTSCGMSPDDMIEEFNKNVYKDVGGGDYIIENGKPSVSASLLGDVYAVPFDGAKRIDISGGFISYKWSCINNDTNSEKEIASTGGTIIIYPSVLNLKVGGNYSLKLIVKNKNGALFTDSAKLIISK